MSTFPTSFSYIAFLKQVIGCDFSILDVKIVPPGFCNANCIEFLLINNNFQLFFFLSGFLVMVET